MNRPLLSANTHQPIHMQSLTILFRRLVQSLRSQKTMRYVNGLLFLYLILLHGLRRKIYNNNKGIPLFFPTFRNTYFILNYLKINYFINNLFLIIFSKISFILNYYLNFLFTSLTLLNFIFNNYFKIYIFIINLNLNFKKFKKSNTQTHLCIR